MKQLTEYITEKLKINKNTSVSDNFKYHPKNRTELMEILFNVIEERGSNADLTDIDVSKVVDFRELFKHVNNIGKKKIKEIDISNWDLSNAEHVEQMFCGCTEFDCDLSKWNVSNIKNFESMFEDCANFKGTGLKNWDMSNAENINYMFLKCGYFNEDLSKWDVSNVKKMSRVFDNCLSFEGIGLYKWNMQNVKDIRGMFKNCIELNCNLSFVWKDLYNQAMWDSDLFYNCKKMGNKKPSWYKV